MACKSINLYLFSVMSVALTHKTAIKKRYILDSSSCLSQSETFSSHFCTLISNVASSVKTFVTAFKMFLILSSPLSKKYFLKCTSLSFPQYATYPYVLVCVVFVCPRHSNSKSIPLFLLCNNHFDSEIDFFLSVTDVLLFCWTTDLEKGLFTNWLPCCMQQMPKLPP